MCTNTSSQAYANLVFESPWWWEQRPRTPYYLLTLRRAKTLRQKDQEKDHAVRNHVPKLDVFLQLHVHFWLVLKKTLTLETTDIIVQPVSSKLRLWTPHLIRCSGYWCCSCWKFLVPPKHLQVATRIYRWFAMDVGAAQILICGQSALNLA